MKKQHVTLSEVDRETLVSLVSRGKQSARAYKRALALLELDRGKTITAVAETLGVSQNTIRTLRDNYKQKSLNCLEDAHRSGRPVEISGEQRAKITALACSEPPEGHARWHLRLLADKIVELDICESVSHTQVANILKKRIEASPEEDLVHWQDQCTISGSNGTCVVGLQSALRSSASCDLFR